MPEGRAASVFKYIVPLLTALAWDSESPSWDRGRDTAGKTEIVIYSVLAVLLAVTAFVTIATAGQILWIGLSHWTVAAQTLRVLNQLLIVLMLVEILHTVRISIHSHVLVTEPFLIVGLIATIRRVLVIALEAATLTKEGAWATEGSSAIFHSSMAVQPII